MPRVDTLDRLLAACGLRLEASPAAGSGVDTTAIDAMLRLTPSERLRLATVEAANLARLQEGRWR